MERLRSGSARNVLAADFAGWACLGFAMAVLATAPFHGHTRAAVDRATALTIAAVLVVMGGVAALRSVRLRVLLADDRLVIVGVTRRRTIPFANVAYLGFGRTLLGRVLYVISTDGRPYFAWGVSSPQSGPESARASVASEILDQIRDAISRRHALPETDPLTDLPATPAETSATPPAGTRLVAVKIGWPLLRTMPEPIAAFMAAMIGVVGFQAAIPWTFPWLLAVVGSLLLLALLLPALVMAPRLRSMARAGIAVGGGWIGIRTGRWWKSLDLRRLAGLGAAPDAFVLSVFGKPRTRRTLRLIDADGRRLDVDDFLLAPEVVSELKEFAAGTVVTELAAGMLALE